jgi:hypothetical protein
MISHMRCCGILSLTALALILGVWGLFDSSVVADDGEVVVTDQGATVRIRKKDNPAHGDTSYGTLGYGPPGFYPGFQGFGLGYHLGYGYGGGALGVGAEGGFPFYAGPGYPHAEPPLRRIGGINPFTYYGGPGYPTPDHPNYFGGIGQLVPDRPVVTIATDRGEPSETADYGLFTGAIPDAEALFAPFTSPAAAGKLTTPGGTSSDPAAIPTNPVTNPGSGSGSPATPSAMGGRTRPSTAGCSLGIDAEPVVDANAARAMKVSNVYPGTAAEKAGLHVGDLIYSINGYGTQARENAEWIIVKAAPDKVLAMSVRAASDGKVRSVRAQLP